MAPWVCLLVGARLEQGRDRRIAWSLHGRSPVVRRVRRCMPPPGVRPAPSGALRAIDPCGAAAILTDLRSAPPSAAIPVCRRYYSEWRGGT